MPESRSDEFGSKLVKLGVPIASRSAYWGIERRRSARLTGRSPTLPASRSGDVCLGALISEYRALAKFNKGEQAPLFKSAHFLNEPCDRLITPHRASALWSGGVTSGMHPHVWRSYAAHYLQSSVLHRAALPRY